MLFLTALLYPGSELIGAAIRFRLLTTPSGVANASAQDEFCGGCDHFTFWLDSHRLAAYSTAPLSARKDLNGSCFRRLNAQTWAKFSACFDDVIISPPCPRARSSGCVVSRVIDQSGNRNHLSIYSKDQGVGAASYKTTLGGRTVYGMYFSPGMGYRNDDTVGVPKGEDPESMYMVVAAGCVVINVPFDVGLCNPIVPLRFASAMPPPVRCTMRDMLTGRLCIVLQCLHHPHPYPPNGWKRQHQCLQRKALQ